MFLVEDIEKDQGPQKAAASLTEAERRYHKGTETVQTSSIIQ